jgi:hypothetical protein
MPGERVLQCSEAPKEFCGGHAVRLSFDGESATTKHIQPARPLPRRCTEMLTGVPDARNKLGVRARPTRSADFERTSRPTSPRSSQTGLELRNAWHVADDPVRLGRRQDGRLPRHIPRGGAAGGFGAVAPSRSPSPPTGASSPPAPASGTTIRSRTTSGSPRSSSASAGSRASSSATLDARTARSRRTRRPTPRRLVRSVAPCQLDWPALWPDTFGRASSSSLAPLTATRRRGSGERRLSRERACAAREPL